MADHGWLAWAVTLMMADAAPMAEIYGPDGSFWGYGCEWPRAEWRQRASAA